MRPIWGAARLLMSRSRLEWSRTDPSADADGCTCRGQPDLGLSLGFARSLGCGHAFGCRAPRQGERDARAATQHAFDPHGAATASHEVPAEDEAEARPG